MTTIKITESYIEVSGHSGYQTTGSDIICSSISVASQFLQNITECEYKDNDTYYKLYVSNKHKAVDVYKELMQQLAVSYPNNVRVIEV